MLKVAKVWQPSWIFLSYPYRRLEHKINHKPSTYESFQVHRISTWLKSVVYIISWEPEGRHQSSRMFRWEPEGRYRITKSMAIALFWFSTEHVWMKIKDQSSRMFRWEPEGRYRSTNVVCPAEGREHNHAQGRKTDNVKTLLVPSRRMWTIKLPQFNNPITIVNTIAGLWYFKTKSCLVWNSDK